MTAEKRYEVKITAAAFQGLSEITGYIAQSSPSAAIKVKNELLQAIRSLSVLPERAPFLDAEFIPCNKYRKLAVSRRFLLLYQIRGNIVRIDYVLDCRQDYQWLLR